MKRREFMKGAVVTGAGAAAAVSTLPKPAIAQGSKESMRRPTISERILERMTKAEIAAAQRAWAKRVVERDVDQLLDLYDFGTPDEPLLFKPTLADVIRLDRAGARSYFVGGNPNYPHDHGFLNRGWKQVDFRSAAGPILTAGGAGLHGYGALHLRRRRRQRDPRRLYVRLSQAGRTGSHLAAPLFPHVASAGRGLNCAHELSRADRGVWLAGVERN